MEETIIDIIDDIRIVESLQDPWFVAKDICLKKGINTADISRRISVIPEEWKKKIYLRTVKGRQPHIALNRYGTTVFVTKMDPQYVKWFFDKIFLVIQEKLLSQLGMEVKVCSEIDIEKSLIERDEKIVELQRQLKVLRKKCRDRHKFTEAKAVYILEDPDSKTEKFKIGRTKNINDRLRSDRTTIPNIKVRYLLYVEKFKEFEDMIKIRCENIFIDPCHEWVKCSLDDLISIYENIDQACGFKGKKDEELWKYNLESPPDEKLKEKIEEKKIIEIVQIPLADLNMEEKFSRLLKTRLDRFQYVSMNKKAPEKQRFCNGFCQCYKLLSDFVMRSAHPLSVCNLCYQKYEIACTRISENNLTEKQVREDHNIITLRDTERLCKKCNKIFNISEFDRNRSQCKECRNKSRSIITGDFRVRVYKEIFILHKMTGFNRLNKLGLYTRDELRLLTVILGIGRLSSDNKAQMVAKIDKFYQDDKFDPENPKYKHEIPISLEKIKKYVSIDDPETMKKCIEETSKENLAIELERFTRNTLSEFRKKMGITGPQNEKKNVVIKSIVEYFSYIVEAERKHEEENRLVTVEIEVPVTDRVDDLEEKSEDDEDIPVVDDEDENGDEDIPVVDDEDVPISPKSLVKITEENSDADDIPYDDEENILYDDE